jgi:hypothetical protein
VKYERTERARNDYAHLDDQTKQLFKDAVVLMNEAYERRGDRAIPIWPKRLRIKAVEDSHGVWEMTWSFTGPDGRATFEYFDAGDGEVGIRWRRIGGHEIFRNP